MIEHHSPSSLNKYATDQAAWFAQYILRIPSSVGASAYRGSAVEDGVTHMMKNPDASFEDCLQVTMQRFDTETGLLTGKKVETIRKGIPALLRNALDALRPYRKDYGEPEYQGKVEWHPPELKVPVIGFYDYHWPEVNLTVDLKTSDKMPPGRRIKASHARQVSLYVGGGNGRGEVIYVTPGEYEIMKLEDVDAHKGSLRNIAQAVERFLSISKDTNLLKSLCVPDLEHFYWGGAMRQVAFEIWGI
jgi:hypothetical protein